MGATYGMAFDSDAQSVAMSQKVKTWSGITDGWSIEQGSGLDRAYIERLGHFDLVCSPVVLHHTGAMWETVYNAAIPMQPGADFYLALDSSDT